MLALSLYPDYILFVNSSCDLYAPAPLCKEAAAATDGRTNNGTMGANGLCRSSRNVHFKRSKFIL